MIVNMSCPKCGGQASEYEEHKWRCLKCGNKFVYAPEPASHTYVQSTVNIHGQTTYELNVEKAKPPMPRREKASEYDPSTFQEALIMSQNELAAWRSGLIEDKARRIWWSSLTAFFGVCVIVTTVGFVTAFYSSADTRFGLLLAATFIDVPIAASCWNRWRKSQHQLASSQNRIRELEQTIAGLELGKQEEITVGHDILCPNCEALFEYVDLDEPFPDGLVHCLKCGKQFFTTKGNAYPVAFR